MQARMREFRSSETEVTPVRRLGLAPVLLTQNILYRSEGMQATAIVLIHAYSHWHTHVHTCSSLWEPKIYLVELYFLNPKPLYEPKS